MLRSSVLSADTFKSLKRVRVQPIDIINDTGGGIYSERAAGKKPCPRTTHLKLRILFEKFRQL